MSYSTPYPPLPIMKPKRPRFLSMLAGFGIAVVVGIIFGLVFSALYSVIGRAGGVQFLTAPIVIVIFGGTTALSFFFTRLIHNKSRAR